jgi:predicted DCC family thiol-disulfide oxidoreductase YuxK
LPELRKKVRAGVYTLPEGVTASSICLNLISALIQLDPQKRINFSALKDHPFVSLDPEKYQEYVFEKEQERKRAAAK